MEEYNVNQPAQPAQPITQQTQYAPYQQAAPTQANSVISIGEWILTIFLLAIPLINLIMLFVWGFGGGAHPTKANFAKAALLWMVIGFVLSLMFLSSILTFFSTFNRF
ncbi:hypothetical protein M2137_000036 [Parabacteroides sp. PFB2-10]|uniref:hypothetical protein n=1 Tax=Parabacteroides sp. PFB2-10 TaxID=1742405 RepID=UPI0024751CE7|nr:hypothetical protein [Parabacteroides sp. PFB2-10]MDH6311286.1 hypothetical protein [Parabacteroides sp. PFB2-10]